MAEWRGRNVGVIFQFFQLLPTLSCLENIMLPMDFYNVYSGSERKDGALYLLELVDRGKTILMAMYERELASGVSRTITLADGVIIGEERH